MPPARLTARALAEAYLSRIEGIDRAGPELRAVIEIAPDVVEVADALDAERRTSGRRLVHRYGLERSDADPHRPPFERATGHRRPPMFAPQVGP